MVNIFAGALSQTSRISLSKIQFVQKKIFSNHISFVFLIVCFLLKMNLSYFKSN